LRVGRRALALKWLNPHKRKWHMKQDVFSVEVPSSEVVVVVFVSHRDGDLKTLTHQ